MITAFLDLFFSLITYLLDFLPPADFSVVFNSEGLNFFKNILSYMLFFFPNDLFTTFMVCVCFWLVVQFVWAVIEFILKKFMLS